MRLSPDLQTPVNVCDKARAGSRRQYIASELFLLAAQQTRETWESCCAVRPGCRPPEQAVARLRNGSRSRTNAEQHRSWKNTPMTDRPGRAGRIDPIIGPTRKSGAPPSRSCKRRTKKQTRVLIGEAGVGKTAIVEGLALAHRNGRSPRRACATGRCWRWTWRR